MSSISPFGNSNALYVPMSDLEREAIVRLVEANDLVVHLEGWGYTDQLQVAVGEHRVSIGFQVTFSAPALPVPVHYFDLSLRTLSSNLLLSQKREPVTINGNPLQVAAGVQLGMRWDLAIQHLDPDFVKSIIPHATGLTSRVLDAQTGKATVKGNMRLTEQQATLIEYLRKGEASVRAHSEDKARRVAKQEQSAVDAGVIKRK